MSEYQLSCTSNITDEWMYTNFAVVWAQFTLRQIIQEMDCEEQIPPGTGKIIGLRVKAEIPKRKHVKEDQQDSSWGRNTYSSEEQKIVEKHIRIRVAEVSLEEINSKIALGDIKRPSFTEEFLFGRDRNNITLLDNDITRTFVHPLLNIKRKQGKQKRLKQSKGNDKVENLIKHSVLELLKGCYGIIDDANIDFDVKIFNLLGISAESDKIFHRIIFTLWQVLMYRGKTIDQIFEEFELSPPTNSDVYKRFTANEKNDIDWPKVTNSFTIDGYRCSGSTPIYYGKHLKQKREEVQQYGEELRVQDSA